jgi:hypothetical protein
MVAWWRGGVEERFAERFAVNGLSPVCFNLGKMAGQASLACCVYKGPCPLQVMHVLRWNPKIAACCSESCG